MHLHCIWARQRGRRRRRTARGRPSLQRVADSLISHHQVGFSSRCCCRCCCSCFLTPMLVSCRVGLCCVGLCGWVAWLRRVGSCCSRWPPGSRGTDNLQVPGRQSRRSGTYYLVHGLHPMHGKKCGEGIRIEAPDSNFGRLVGWQWVGAGFTGFNSSPPVDQVGNPSPRRWYTRGHRAREPEKQRARQTDRHAAPVRQAPCSGPPSRSSSHNTPSAPQARPRPAVSGGTARSPPTHSAGPPVPARPSPASTLALCISRLSRACVPVSVCLSVPGLRVP